MFIKMRDSTLMRETKLVSLHQPLRVSGGQSPQDSGVRIPQLQSHEKTTFSGGLIVAGANGRTSQLSIA